MNTVWEYRDFTFSRDVARADIKALLTSLAEVERWELDRVRITNDGRRFVRVRRKVFLLRRSA
jgi:hypothetical protein